MTFQGASIIGGGSLVPDGISRLSGDAKRENILKLFKRKDGASLIF